MTTGAGTSDGDHLRGQIVIHTTITWDVEHRDEAIGLMVEQQQRTRELAGCLGCVWSADLDDPAVFHEFEWWGSEAAFQNHVSNGPKYTPHARRLIRRVLSHRFDTASVTKLH